MMSLVMLKHVRRTRPLCIYMLLKGVKWFPIDTSDQVAESDVDYLKPLKWYCETAVSLVATFHVFETPDVR